MDPDPDSDPAADPDPSVFIIDLQDANKKQIFFKSFPAYYFLKVLLHHFPKIGTTRIWPWSTKFCVAEGGPRPESVVRESSRQCESDPKLSERSQPENETGSPRNQEKFL